MLDVKLKINLLNIFYKHIYHIGTHKICKYNIILYTL